MRGHVPIPAALSDAANDPIDVRFGGSGVLSHLFRCGKIKERRPCIDHPDGVISVDVPFTDCLVCHRTGGSRRCPVSRSKIQIPRPERIRSSCTLTPEAGCTAFRFPFHTPGPQTDPTPWSPASPHPAKAEAPAAVPPASPSCRRGPARCPRPSPAAAGLRSPAPTPLLRPDCPSSRAPPDAPPLLKHLRPPVRKAAGPAPAPPLSAPPAAGRFP